MKFFCGDDVVVYPDTPQELKEQMILEATVGPQRKALAFLMNYFKETPHQDDFLNHPLLGDLRKLVIEIEEKWDIRSAGLNTVTTMLRQKLDMAPFPFTDPRTPSNTPEDQSPNDFQDYLAFGV